MNVKSNKGSITVFVLVALLFMTGFLIISYGSNINKSKSSKEQFNIISSIYSHGDTDADSYKRAYTVIRKRNAQILKESVENSSLLQIDKAFDDNLIDYKIYGNTIQDTSTLEIQSVGDTVNLIDYSKAITRKDVTSTSASQTITINEEEQSITWTGDYYFEIPLPEAVSSGKTICLSLNSTDNTITRWTVVYEDNSYPSELTHIKTSITPEKSVVAVRTYIDMENIDTANKETVTITINNIMLEYGSVPTRYIPYGEYCVQIEVSGKNVMDFTKVQDTSATTTTLLDNGFNVNGKYAGKVVDIKVVPNTDYYLQYSVEHISYEGVGDPVSNVSVFPNHSTSTRIARFSTDEGGTFNTGNNTSIQIWFYAGNGKVGEVNFTNIQLTKGTEKKSTSEPFYKESVAKDIIIDEPLRKIGTVSDYIDFSTGRVVRKIEKIESYNGETISTEWISSTGELSTGATVYYVLEDLKYEDAEVPDILTYEDYTCIQVVTEIVPSKIEVTYYGYTIE